MCGYRRENYASIVQRYLTNTTWERCRFDLSRERIRSAFRTKPITSNKFSAKILCDEFIYDSNDSSRIAIRIDPFYAEQSFVI